MKWLNLVGILLLIVIFCVGFNCVKEIPSPPGSPQPSPPGVKYTYPEESSTPSSPTPAGAPTPKPTSVPAPIPTPKNPRFIYENDGIHVGGDGEPIELINNPNAADPTYAELVEFIVRDLTNTGDYVKGGPDSYVCSDFAEAVHNNAEAAGIRAAWVSIDLEGNDEGHALNAFETTDKGLVYIDCTGKLKKTWTGSLLPNGEWSGSYLPAPDPTPLNQLLYGKPVPESAKITARDTVAYIEVGKEYGMVGINEAKSLEYGFYLEYKQKWQDYDSMLEDYNQEVEEYNQEIKGKVYTIGSPEAQRIETWEAELERKEKILDNLEKELGYYFYELQDTSESAAIVKDVHIHWGNN